MMRYSLRFLLFIAPCILVAAYFVIWHVQGYFDSKKEDKSIPAWDNTQSDIDLLTEDLAERKITLNELSVAELNLWFKEEIPATSAAAILMKAYDYHAHKTDSWDRPLVAISLDENHQPTQDSTNAKSIGIYSKGRDGISNSHGCDPDDLASWRREEGLAYYENLKEEHYWRGRKIRALVTLIVGTFGVLLLWVIGVVGYRMLFKKA